MPGFYEGEPVARISGELRAEEYAQAWVMLEQRYGTLRTAGKKALALAVMLVLLLCLLPWYAARYASFYIPAVVAALCLFGIWWQLLYRPAAAYRRGLQNYRSNRLITLPAQLTLYRDSYFIQNQYEEKNGYWTDFAACVETDSLIVAMGGWERRMLVIAKRNVPAQEQEALSSLLENTFATRYHRIFQRSKAKGSDTGADAKTQERKVKAKKIGDAAPKGDPLADVSYLITKEDYAAYCLLVSRSKITRQHRLLQHAVGFLMILAGAALFVFYGGNLFDKIVWVLLAAAGLAVAFYEDALLPFLVRRQAESQYEQRKDELTAQSVRLYQNGVEVHADRYRAWLPFTALYQSAGDENGFVLFLSPEQTRYLPRRVLTQREADVLIRLLANKAKARYLDYTQPSQKAEAKEGQSSTKEENRRAKPAPGRKKESPKKAPPPSESPSEEHADDQPPKQS